MSATSWREVMAGTAATPGAHELAEVTRVAVADPTDIVPFDAARIRRRDLAEYVRFGEHLLRQHGVQPGAPVPGAFITRIDTRLVVRPPSFPIRSDYETVRTWRFAGDLQMLASVFQRLAESSALVVDQWARHVCTADMCDHAEPLVGEWHRQGVHELPGTNGGSALGLVVVEPWSSRSAQPAYSVVQQMSASFGRTADPAVVEEVMPLT